MSATDLHGNADHASVSYICHHSLRILSQLSACLQVQLKREGKEGSAHLVELQGQHQELQKQLQQAQKVN